MILMKAAFYSGILHINMYEMLQLFNEKVDKLKRNPFLEKVGPEKSGPTFSIKINTGADGSEPGVSGTIGRIGPNEPEMDAYILTLRMFIRDRDGISLNMIESYYRQYLSGDDDRINNIVELRQRWRDYLSQGSSVTINKVNILKEEIFDVFIWGYFSHAEERYRNIFDNWKHLPLFQWMVDDFVNMLNVFYNIIHEIKVINVQILDEIKQGDKSNQKGNNNNDG